MASRLSTRPLENGLTVTIVAGYAYDRVSVTEARRWLVLEAMQPEYENKSLVDVKGGADRFVTSRHVTEDGKDYRVFDVAEMWEVFNPTQFSNSYEFSRVLMGEDQGDFMKCEDLHVYPSLEFRQHDSGGSPTYRPMLSPKDLLHFFTSPFFCIFRHFQHFQHSHAGASGSGTGTHMPGNVITGKGHYRLCMFDEDVAREPAEPALNQNQNQVTHQEHCKHSPAPASTTSTASTASTASTRSWPKHVASSMHALTTTRQLLQEVRDLHERDDVPQQPKQSKRRRMEDIKSQAMENLLTGIVEANIEMHELLMPELRMPEHRE